MHIVKLNQRPHTRSIAALTLASMRRTGKRLAQRGALHDAFVTSIKAAFSVELG